MGKLKEQMLIDLENKTADDEGWDGLSFDQEFETHNYLADFCDMIEDLGVQYFKSNLKVFNRTIYNEIFGNENDKQPLRCALTDSK